MKEAKVQEFLNQKHDTFSVHEYGLKFIQLSLYDPQMVKKIRIKMILFVANLGYSLSKEGRVAMLICNMDIYRLMVYVYQVEEEKMWDR